VVVGLDARWIQWYRWRLLARIGNVINVRWDNNIQKESAVVAVVVAAAAVVVIVVLAVVYHSELGREERAYFH